VICLTPPIRIESVDFSSLTSPLGWWSGANTKVCCSWKGGPPLEFADRILKCIECGAEFVFSAGEQAFFHDKQFTNDPKRCKNCKAKRTKKPFLMRVETHLKCSECGAETTVPFKPTKGLPVLCRDCFRKSLQGPYLVKGTTPKLGNGS